MWPSLASRFATATPEEREKIWRHYEEMADRVMFDAKIELWQALINEQEAKKVKQ